MKLFLSFLFFFALSACGTLFVGQNQTILIDSVPSDVSIYQNGKFLGTTPLTAEVERTRKPLMLKAEKEGYNPQAIMMDSSLGWGGVFDGVFALLFITGSTGFSTDASNETIWSYTPGQYFVYMIKTGEENMRDSKTLLFITKNFETLRMEAADGKGQTLNALSELTGKNINLLIPAINESAYPSDLVKALLQ
ncbi:MAG: PEGA domain-containing protein [Alphaproteobacteria bacterium]|nr:PEGA domain-containing protein [Alphaproteobacteria bacterium]